MVGMVPSSSANTSANCSRPFFLSSQWFERADNVLNVNVKGNSKSYIFIDEQ
jgi:hypothetical protein